MCGIAGWYRRGGRPVARETIARQCDRIVHRGPDDSGDLVGRRFRLRHAPPLASSTSPAATSRSPRRTAAIRSSSTARSTTTSSCAASSARPGFAFRTQSDTETLLASFVHWRDDAWLRLEGMYAVAIWDHVGRTLTLARDPLGIKPLYLTQQNDGIAFASEIRALRVLPDIGSTSTSAPSTISSASAMCRSRVRSTGR